MPIGINCSNHFIYLEIGIEDKILQKLSDFVSSAELKEFSIKTLFDDFYENITLQGCHQEANFLPF